MVNEQIPPSQKPNTSLRLAKRIGLDYNIKKSVMLLSKELLLLVFFTGMETVASFTAFQFPSIPTFFKPPNSAAVTADSVSKVRKQWQKNGQDCFLQAMQRMGGTHYVFLI
jgi:hypothetical protein